MPKTEKASITYPKTSGMLSTSMELLTELIQVLIFGALGIGLSVGGAYAERFAFVSLQAGDTILAGWAAVLGALFILFAYLVARDNLAPTVRAIRERATD